MPAIRPIAIGIIRKNGKILVFRGWDDCDMEYFYRPLGGGIEFGETGAEAVSRELYEEIGVRLVDVRYLFTLENIFTCNGKKGHEIVLVFEAAVADRRFYELEEITGGEDSGEPLQVCWVGLDEFAAGDKVLVPEELLLRL